MTRLPILLSALAVFAAGCSSPDSMPEADPFDGSQSFEKSLVAACTGNAGCTAAGEDLSIYTATYRVGATTTSRGELVQTFKATASGYPDRVTLALRHLRAFTLPEGASALQLHVGIFAAGPDGFQAGPVNGYVAVGDLALNTFSATGATLPTKFPGGMAEVALEASDALVEGTSYGLELRTDGLAADVAGTVMLGVGALAASTYTDGFALRAESRRTSATGTWGEVRYRPAGAWLVYADVSTTSTCPTCPPTVGRPSAPGDVTAHAGAGSALVIWSAPTDDGGAAIDSYRVTSTPGNVSVTTTGPVTSVTIPGLTNGTAYTFRVVATNANGDGPPSAPSAAVTPSPCAENNGGCSPFGTCTAAGDNAVCACPPLYDAVGATCVRHSPIANGAFEGSGGWVAEGEQWRCDGMGFVLADDAVHGHSMVFMNSGCKLWQAAALDVDAYASVRLRVDVRGTPDMRPVEVRLSTGPSAPYDQQPLGTHWFVSGELSEVAALDGTTVIPPGPWYAWTSADLKALLPAGTQMLRVDVVPGDGGYSSWIDNVALVLDDAALPTLTAAATPTTGHTPLPVALAGTCADGDGACAGSWWSIADGENQAFLTVHSALSGDGGLHPFTRTGETLASFTVQDDRGGTHTQYVSVTTSNEPPTAAVTASPAIGAGPLPVSFSAHAQDDFHVASYAWDLGDGTTSTAVNPTHTYTIPGTYHATLTVTDDDGATGFSETWIVVTGATAISDGGFEANTGWERDGNWWQCDNTGQRVTDDAVHGASLLFGNAGSGCALWQAAVLDPSAHTSVRLRVDTRQGFMPRTLLVRLSTGPSAPWTQTVIGTHTFTEGAFSDTAALEGTTAIPSGPWYAWTSEDLKPLLAGGNQVIRVDLIAGADYYAWLDNVQFVFDDPSLPTGTPSVTPATGHAPLPVTLDGTCEDADGACASASWSIGDGTPDLLFQGQSSLATAAGEFTFTSTGTTRLSYTVEDEQGGARTYLTEVTTTNLPPTTNVVADPATGVFPLDVAFTSNATDDAGVVSWAWTFGDGTTSTEADPAHTYLEPGTYLASVTVTDANGATASSSTLVVAAGPTPVANGTFESYTGWLKEGVSWQCDSATQITADDVVHGTSAFFMNTGCTLSQVAPIDVDAHTSVRLRVDLRGSANVRPLLVRISTGPGAPWNQQVIGTHTFVGGLLSESGALEATTAIPSGPWYAWTSDDLTPLLPVGTQFLRVEVSPGSDGSFVWFDNVALVLDDDALPTQAFTATPSSGTAPLEVTFTGSCADADGTCAAGSWSFGDSPDGWNLTTAAATGYSATHAFAEGSFVVSYTVVDDQGGARTGFTSVSTTNVPPTASFTADVPVGPSPLAVHFTSVMSDPDGAIASWSWSFGDGSTSTDEHPTHTFVHQGTYVVTLTVADEQGGLASTHTAIVAQ